jgi:hypothetical protein
MGPDPSLEASGQQTFALLVRWFPGPPHWCQDQDLTPEELLVKLAWVEMKIFSREPLGLVGAVLISVPLFVVLGQLAGRSWPGRRSGRRARSAPPCRCVPPSS